jgi:N-acetyltransferase
MRVESFRPPLTLEGRSVRLVPLDPIHAVRLREAGQDREVFRFLQNGPGTTREEMNALIRLLLQRQTEGTDLAFTIVETSRDLPVGMTRYLHIDRPNDAVEIGGTWLDRRHWRTPLNTESKYLLLRHAFEREEAHRVCLQTDVRNERSQRAIERLGAVREAVLRDDRLLPDGGYRSSVFYSILASEWPTVKRSLEEKLSRPWTAPP